MDISSVLFLFGAMVGYLVIISDVFAPFLQTWSDSNSIWVSREMVQLYFLLAIIYPLCLLKKIDSLRLKICGGHLDEIELILFFFLF